MNRYVVLLVVSCYIAVMAIPVVADVVNVADNIGGVYELDELEAGIKVFSDRDHIFNSIPDKFIGATYIRCPVQSVKGTPNIEITVEIDTPSQVYIIWYTEERWIAGNNVKNAAPPVDWLKNDYEMLDDELNWGPDMGFNPWKSKTVLPAGEFVTYTTGNDCAYGIFLQEAELSVEPLDKLATTWSSIRAR